MKFKNLFLAFLFAVSLPSPILAADLSPGAWHASGSQVWRTSFPLPLGYGASSGSSELFYPHNGSYYTFNFHNQFSKSHSFNVEVGLLGSLKNGIGSDTDWKDGHLWYFGEFQTGGSAFFVNVDRTVRQTSYFEFKYGYSFRNNFYRMANGVYHLMDSNPQNPPLLLPDLASTYSLTYHGPFIGTNVRAPLTAKLSAFGALSYTPLMFAQGRGWWNLRTLDFTHTGSGQMLDGSIGLRYEPKGCRQGSYSFGYRYQRYGINRGWENSNPDIAWEKATNIQKGYFFTGNYKF